ncbi:alpha/beta fold hydrolase [Ornithinimicrobium sp. W1679]|uniref:alpha/beta fold hydrolase n=1 Tax=Ornithinimicrobium sp. W1679 TaxID=3418770 RepID=UPI003CFB5DAE
MSGRTRGALPQRVHGPAGRAVQDPAGPGGRDLPGVDPAWSRVVVAPDAEGTPRRWHLLDTHPDDAVTARPTLLCVHGNPTWSYLWRRVLEQAPAGWRVVAVDQLGMGWSERPDRPRTLPQRIEDLSRLTVTLGLTGPVAVAVHDWGGPVGLGWALRHRAQLAGLVVTNTAVHQPTTSAPPAVIRLARAPGVLAQVCRRTPLFVRATTALSLPPLPADVRRAFAAPYATPGRRAAVADFVADIPVETDHPSRPTLDAVAAELGTLADVPALMVWGPRDPVFGQRYLDDLLTRLPHADVQRWAGASHLVLEDRPRSVPLIWEWLTERVGPGTPGAPGDDGPSSPGGPVHGRTGHGPVDDPAAAVARVPVRVDDARPEATAVAELGGAGRRITFGQLAARVEEVAAGFAAGGVRPGDRVAVLVPPGIDLTTVVYALWRVGAVVVVADAGLGLARLGAALRSAGPRHVVGIGRALALTAVTRVPGRRWRVEPGGAGLDELAARGRDAGPEARRHAEPGGDQDGAVLFTSGATGPPKGVVYTRDQLGAQVALLRDTFDLLPGQSLVAAFAPFALYGPALGLSSAVPDMDVTAPHTLTAPALAEAVAAVGADAVFASPAALRNVVATADRLDAAQRRALAGPRLLMSAGAPVPVELLHRVREVLPSAATHTPYGMTEVLPVATHDPTTTTTSTAPSPGAGVCVGTPVPGVDVALAPLQHDGTPADGLVTGPGVVGEIVVRGPHVKDRYDRLWATQRASARPAGWHRTGDVGHLDEERRLWVEGRLAHVVRTADGPVTPYPVENRVREVPGVHDVAVVGVGPAGTQQVVVVVVPPGRAGPRARWSGAPGGARRIAPPAVAAAVRERAGVPVAAVLVRDWLPVDVRHASKIDRTAVASWAEGTLHASPGPAAAVAALRSALRPRAPRRRSR